MKNLTLLSALASLACAMRPLGGFKRFAPADTSIVSPTISPPVEHLGSRGDCSDNCGRAVAGTRKKNPDLVSRSSDCVSFLRNTVYTYNHLNITASLLTPTFIPSYASACSPTLASGSPQSAYSSAYASACKCFDLTPTTVTSTATYDPTCTKPASNDSCDASLPRFGPVPADLVLRECANAVPAIVPGCSCQLDTEGRAFCDAGFAGYAGKECKTSADCEEYERCAINKGCYKPSCERTAPGEQCDNRTARIIYKEPGARGVVPAVVANTSSAILNG